MSGNLYVLIQGFISISPIRTATYLKSVPNIWRHAGSLTVLKNIKRGYLFIFCHAYSSMCSYIHAKMHKHTQIYRQPRRLHSLMTEKESGGVVLFWKKKKTFDCGVISGAVFLKHWQDEWPTYAWMLSMQAEFMHIICMCNLEISDKTWYMPLL